MNILTYWTHESFQWSLAKTGHRFYNLPSSARPSGWNSSVKPCPENMLGITLEDAQSGNVKFDLILSQCDSQYKDSLWFQGPRLHIEHTTYPYIKEPYWDCSTVFITEYNKNMWSNGPTGQPVKVIRHGIDPNEWLINKYERVDPHYTCPLTVVQNFKARDWCCGYSLFNWITRDMYPAIYGHGNNDIRYNDVGSKSWDDVKCWFANYAVYVNTSLHSPVPMAMLEAMAAGMPIVSTDNCELGYYINDHYNGIINNDPAILRQAIIDFMDNVELAKVAGVRARESIFELCNIDRFVKEWNLAFEETVEGK